MSGSPIRLTYAEQPGTPSSLRCAGGVRAESVCEISHAGLQVASPRCRSADAERCRRGRLRPPRTRSRPSRSGVTRRVRAARPAAATEGDDTVAITAGAAGHFDEGTFTPPGSPNAAYSATSPHHRLAGPVRNARVRHVPAAVVSRFGDRSYRCFCCARGCSAPADRVDAGRARQDSSTSHASSSATSVRTVGIRRPDSYALMLGWAMPVRWPRSVCVRPA